MSPLTVAVQSVSLCVCDPTSVYMCRMPCSEMQHFGEYRCKWQHSQVLAGGSCYTAGCQGRVGLCISLPLLTSHKHRHARTTNENANVFFHETMFCSVAVIFLPLLA